MGSPILGNVSVAVVGSKDPMSVKPNFLCIGPSKSGSTWIYEAMRLHPQVFLPSIKELHYFDYYYHLGRDWYYKYFQDAKPEHKLVGEMSPDYMYFPEAIERISTELGTPKMLVCLRDPVERLFSEYLYTVKLGFDSGNFEDVIERQKHLVDHSMYGKLLLRYKQKFGREALIITDFKDIANDPEKFFLDLCETLEIEPKIPEGFTQGKVHGASSPRNFLLAKYAKRVANFMWSHGMTDLGSKIKSQKWVQKTLYKKYEAGAAPQINPETAARLKKHYEGDVRLLDREFGTDFATVWGYEPAPAPSTSDSHLA